MKRVHQTVPQSGEIVCVDSTSNLDRNDSKVFHLVCPSPIGGLPLATIITSREDTETLVFALQVLQSVLPSYAFYGRGPKLGPQVLMTDDCDAERNALAIIWSAAKLLLCIFHVLQAQWVWLWAQEHGIEHKDRPILLNLFRAILYAENKSDRDNRIKILHEDPTFLKYPQVSPLFC